MTTPVVTLPLQHNGRLQKTAKPTTSDSVKKPITHSGHFMTSNLDDDDDYVDGLGRGLGVDGVTVDDDVVEKSRKNTDKRTGYDFGMADKTPKDKYKFGPEDGGTKFDASLAKLFACMSIAYHGKLTTPKFKAFKGLQINIKDKMRLNNIIWREWHLQYIKQHKPLVCSFSINMEDTHSKPQSVVLEGKYWKRKLDIVCIEYKKWRRFHQMRLKPKLLEDSTEISDLLEKLAEQPAQHNVLPSHIQIENVQLSEEEFKMDFSDTLFTSFGNYGQQAATENHRELHSLGNPEFIQPNLLGLQPMLDDFTNMDTLEPFHDLLAEALGQTSTPSMTFTSGSRNTIGFNDYFTTQSQLSGQQIYQLENTSNLYSTDPAATSPGFQQQQQQQQVVIAEPQKTPSYTVFDPVSGQQVVNAGWTHPIITQLPQEAIIPPSVQPKEEFTKPKCLPPRKPRHIAPAPNTYNQAAGGTLNGTSQPSFLAQLLMSSNPSQGKSTTVPNVLTSSTNTILHTSPDGIPLLTVNRPVNPAAVSPNSSFIGGDESFSANTSPQSSEEPSDDRKTVHTTAEQKRRCHINTGFDTLTALVPSLMQSSSSKVSKAAMLSKTAEFAMKLKQERQQMQEEADILHQEIEALNAAISNCQCQLPATGVPVTRQHSDQMKQMLQTHVAEKTMQNWKYYIFAQIASPLFDSFNNIVSTASVDELYRTTQAWMGQHCALPALRPAVLNSLRNLGVQTSILSEPSKFPEQAREAVTRDTNKGS